MGGPAQGVPPGARGQVVLAALAQRPGGVRRVAPVGPLRADRGPPAHGVSSWRCLDMVVTLETRRDRRSRRTFVAGRDGRGAATGDAVEAVVPCLPGCGPD